jgi:hypothetical protein
MARVEAHPVARKIKIKTKKNLVLTDWSIPSPYCLRMQGKPVNVSKAYYF